MPVYPTHNILIQTLYIQQPISSVEDIVCDDKEQLHSGFFQSVEVGFEDVGMVLKQKRGKSDRVLLDGSLRGFAKPGRMLAIMGPSGR